MASTVERRLNDNKRSGTRAAQRARSNERIIRAATDILDGADDVEFSARAVAKRAGVSPGLVVQRFESLADLALEVYLNANAESVGMMAAATREYDDPEQRVIAAFQGVAERDLSRKTLTGTVMAFAWTWTIEHERRKQITWNQIADLLTEALDDSDRPTKETDRLDAALAIMYLYNASLRASVVCDEDASACIARMQPAIKLILAGLYRGVAE